MPCHKVAKMLDSHDTDVHTSLMNTTTAAFEQVTIGNVTYDVLDIDTPETHEAQGRVNTAVHLIQNGVARQLTLVRPNGGKVFHAVQFESGRFSTVSSLFFSITKAEKLTMPRELAESRAKRIAEVAAAK